MSPTQKKRLKIIGLIVTGVAIAAFFALRAFQANIEYFLTPAEISAGEFEPGVSYRIAGLVQKGSVSTLADGVTHQFTITDCVDDVVVQYTGILPDLFREGQAIVSLGKLNADKLMIASQVLAKHDENYVPTEAADAMMLAQASKCDNAEGPISY
ncbi:MAG: cytochrome c maturation protein CcmE [Gammaproteobacteria bacterium]|nr:cytochrome c maturation protein CcmE [Gammaproteobacteria bacterium]